MKELGRMTELDREHFVNLWQAATQEAQRAAPAIAAELKEGADRARLVELSAATFKAWRRVETHLGGSEATKSHPKS